jgi:nucleoside-diphosphate-sugar epimerase
MPRLLITGAAGLIGREVARLFEQRGYEVVRFDIREAVDSQNHGNVRDPVQLARALAGCDGIMHFAAVSRVIWAEREPQLCWATNVDATAALLQCAGAAAKRPWVLFASSREVYGEQQRLPVEEDAELAPTNIYGRAKVAGERLVASARADGLRVATVRLSNVFGRVWDYPDRLVPAFARAAACGTTMRLEGPANCFDLTHVDDVVLGLATLARMLEDGERLLPPIHLVSGVGTTLEQLALLAARIARVPSRVEVCPVRSFDVHRFIGDPERARALLGWRARINVEEGLRRLINDYAALLDSRTAATKAEL